MELEGRCYCGDLRYRIEGDPMFRGECFCRECQYISGGGPNILMGVPEAGFAYTQGEPQAFTRSDLENPVTREFCGRCGTHILTRVPGLPGALVLKVGTLDDPSVFGKPEMAIFAIDRQSYHQLPEGVPALQRGAGSDPVT